MPSDLAERIWQLVKLIRGAGGFGSVTLVIEKGKIARLVWSVDELLSKSGPQPDNQQ